MLNGRQVYPKASQLFRITQKHANTLTHARSSVHDHASSDRAVAVFKLTALNIQSYTPNVCLKNVIPSFGANIETCNVPPEQ